MTTHSTYSQGYGAQLDDYYNPLRANEKAFSKDMGPTRSSKQPVPPYSMYTCTYI